MAKNNYGILTWRAPSDAPKAVASIPKASIPPTQKQPQREAPAGEVTLHSKLNPKEGQKAVLDSMFSGPILLRELLSRSTVKPKTSEDAALFLLQHHKELQPFLYAAQDRTNSVELLKRLVLDWAVSVPELIELEFPGDCSISAANQVFFPIPQLGTLQVKDESGLVGHRKGRCYSPSFVLIHSPRGYVVEIEFNSQGRREPLSHSNQPAKQLAKTSPKRLREVATRLSFDQYLMMFDSAVKAQLMQELRFSRRFVSTDYDALQGREVLGGLPSLGKR